MLALLSLLGSLALAPDMDAHEAINPLYKLLRTTGVSVSPTVKFPLPPPMMPDGLDAKAQQAILRKVAGEDYSDEEFQRKSVVAPFALKITDLKPSDPQAPARGVAVYFVAYGDFDALTNKETLDSLMDSGGKEGKARPLTAEDLAKRKIPWKKDDEKHESYGHVVFTFLEKVQISATGRAYWSRTPDSVLVASELDPRFVGDPEFPNQWRPVTREGGEAKLGPAKPYSGAGQYLKITRLAEPKGAMFVEMHVVFAEPAGWFEGPNFLRSKLPPATQKVVRDMRRELLKAKKK